MTNPPKNLKQCRLEVWKNGNLGKWKFGKMKIWKNGNFGKWKYGKIEIFKNGNFDNGNMEK